MSTITWGSQYDEWQYDKSMIQKACEFLYSLATNTQHYWLYQMFWGWYNPRTNKFEYSLNSRTCLVQHDGGGDWAGIHHK